MQQLANSRQPLAGQVCMGGCEVQVKNFLSTINVLTEVATGDRPLSWTTSFTQRQAGWKRNQRMKNYNPCVSTLKILNTVHVRFGAPRVWQWLPPGTSPPLEQEAVLNHSIVEEPEGFYLIT